MLKQPITYESLRETIAQLILSYPETSRIRIPIMRDQYESLEKWASEHTRKMDDRRKDEPINLSMLSFAGVIVDFAIFEDEGEWEMTSVEITRQVTEYVPKTSIQIYTEKDKFIQTYQSI